ncbi:MAG TPA: class I SAM-dependent methyltransferase [Bacteroidales bacterium]|nr:class I SAM-dependent methyltransferase [Bacteroidales bacterium]
MPHTIEYIIDRISELNALHSKKLKKNIDNCDLEYFERAEVFLKKYESMLLAENKTLDFAIDCYLRMLADVNYETVQFLRNGSYSNSSFTGVNERIYRNPDIMTYYMHGLLLSQFLWIQHYKVFQFFIEIITDQRRQVKNYLEVGGGHGLFISEAIRVIGKHACYDMVDISKSSIELAKCMTGNNDVLYHQTDIRDYNSPSQYDFITMGEVMEHVEDPAGLLRKTFSLLNDGGSLFITTPTNAPAIDHIYLFNNAGEIRKIISEAGFEIKDELCVYSEDMPAAKAEKNKVSMMYAGVLKKTGKS